MKKKNIILSLCIATVFAFVVLIVRLLMQESFTSDRWYIPDQPLQMIDTRDMNIYAFPLELIPKTLQPIVVKLEKDPMVQSFLQPVAQKITDQSIFQIIDQRKQLHTRLEERVRRGLSWPQSIPNLIHYVWISWIDDPFDIPEAQLTRMEQQLKQLHPEFKVWVWFNDLVSQKKNIQRIKQMHPQVQCFSITMYDVVQYGTDLFDVYYQHKRFRQCAELVAYNVLYQYGGVYCDFDVIFDPQLKLESILGAEFIVAQSNVEFIYQTHILGCVAQNIVYKAYLLMLEDLYRYTSIQKDLRTPKHQVTWSSGAGLTLVMDMMLNQPDLSKKVCVALNQYSTDIVGYWKRGDLGQQPIAQKPISTAEYTFTRKVIPRVGFYANPQSDAFIRLRWGVDLFAYFAKMDNLDPKMLAQNRKQIEQTFFKTLNQPRLPSSSVIPKILHKVWLTTHTELSEDQLNYMIRTSKRLKDWQIMFWTNATEHLPKTIQALKDQCLNVSIIQLEPKHIPYAQRIYEAFLDHQEFARAKDVLVPNLIYQFGGLYVDMGVEIVRDCSGVIADFDRVFYHREMPICTELNVCNLRFVTSQADISIIGARKDDLLFKRWLTDLHEQNYRRYDYTYFSSSYKQYAFTGCEYLFYLIEAYFSKDKYLFLPKNSYIQIVHLSSWQKSALLANTVDLWKI
jgi:mannosyltransferase OCH1-like enzyme